PLDVQQAPATCEGEQFPTLLLGHGDHRRIPVVHPRGTDQGKGVLGIVRAFLAHVQGPFPGAVTPQSVGVGKVLVRIAGVGQDPRRGQVVWPSWLGRGGGGAVIALCGLYAAGPPYHRTTYLPQPGEEQDRHEEGCRDPERSCRGAASTKVCRVLRQAFHPTMA